MPTPKRAVCYFSAHMDSTKTLDRILEVLVCYPDSQRTLQAARGENLLDVLRAAGIHLVAPCGGKGTCGKCKVDVAGEGPKEACSYQITRPIRITLPDRRRAAILEDSIFPLAVDAGRDNCFDSLDHGKTQRCEGDHGSAALVETRHERGRALGAAVDIGTTTVVVCIEDPSSNTSIDTLSFINPQVAYGSDVVSRIHQTMNSPGGLLELKTAIVGALNRGLLALAERNHIDLNRIAKLTITGNTTMLHLILGIDPSPIAIAPYTPRFTNRQSRTAAEIGLELCDRVPVELLPSVSGYVGADIVSGLAMTPITASDRVSLYVDLGTNGEMVLGNREWLTCCATAAGPAFEGARIKCGVGGIEGAIASFSNGHYGTIGGGPPLGICGSGLLDIVAELLRNNLVDQSGFMECDFLIEKAAMSLVDHDIVLTPEDIREVQLAKAAVHAGIKLLMNDASLQCCDIDKVYLAGGFGTFLRVESAVTVGLIPAELGSKCVAVGNTALLGARQALRSRAFDSNLDLLATRCRYIELSTRPDFMDEYVAAMSFDTDPFTKSITGLCT